MEFAFGLAALWFIGDRIRTNADVLAKTAISDDGEAIGVTGGPSPSGYYRDDTDPSVSYAMSEGFRGDPAMQSLYPPLEMRTDHIANDTPFDVNAAFDPTNADFMHMAEPILEGRLNGHDVALLIAVAGGQ